MQRVILARKSELQSQTICAQKIGLAFPRNLFQRIGIFRLSGCYWKRQNEQISGLQLSEDI